MNYALNGTNAAWDCSDLLYDWWFEIQFSTSFSHIFNYSIARLEVYCSLIYYIFSSSQLEQKTYITPKLIAQQKYMKAPSNVAFSFHPGGPNNWTNSSKWITSIKIAAQTTQKIRHRYTHCTRKRLFAGVQPTTTTNSSSRPSVFLDQVQPRGRHDFHSTPLAQLLICNQRTAEPWDAIRMQLFIKAA